MANRSNEHVLEGSIKNFKRAQRLQMLALLEQTARWLLYDCYSLANGWLGFTGNLPTSYAAGIYDDNRKLVKIIFIGEEVAEWDKPTVSGKIPKGRTLKLLEPYEGRRRLNVYSAQEDKVIRNPTTIVNPSGKELSKQILQQWKPTADWTIVITTGAEYSEWLEKDRGGDGVLTGAWKHAGAVWNAVISGVNFDSFFEQAAPMQGFETLYDTPF